MYWLRSLTKWTWIQWGVSNVLCEIYRCIGHGATECQLGNFTPQGPSMEQVSFINNFNQRVHNNSFSNTYNPSWSNHPNLSNKKPQNQVGLSNFKLPPRFQPGLSHPPQFQSSNLESTLKNFVANQNEQYQLMSDQIQQLSSKVESIAMHNKMLETQIAQQASNSPNLKACSLVNHKLTRTSSTMQWPWGVRHHKTRTLYSGFNLKRVLGSSWPSHALQSK